MSAFASSQQNNLRKKVFNLPTYRLIYHGLFWLVVLAFLMIIENTDRGFWFRLGNELVNIVFYASLVYFNLLYLIPNYLTPKRFMIYAALLVVSTLVATPLRVMVLYLKFADYPALREDLLTNLNLYFLLTFSIVSGSTVLKIISEWFRQLREKQELQTETMQSELRFLKSQINPHFLFNTLNNLYALTLKKSDKAPEIVIKLSEMMRYMLYECNEKRVPLSKEIHYLRNYLDLEQLRQGGQTEISFTVHGEVSEQQIAPLLFIPFLENSFKHGLNNIHRNFVNIRMDVDHHHLHFFIENSKPDIPPRPDSRRSGGIGLVNVRRRLNLLYPNNYELRIADSPKTYAVNLTIDLD